MAVDRCTVEIPRLQIRVDSPPPVAPAPAARGQQHTHRQQQHTGYTGKTSPLSPVTVQGSKLPPLNHSAAATAAAGDPSRVALQKASDEVGEAMKHLLGEAQSAESRIQKGIDNLWQTMREMMALQLQQQMAVSRKELEEVQAKLARSTCQEGALVQQNAKTYMQLTMEEKRTKELEKTIQKLTEKLSQCERTVEEGKRQLVEMDKKRKTEQEILRGQLDEKAATLREYQAKISKLTEKMNKISKDLTSEKMAAEKLQKNNSGQLSQQVSDNRKLALEISKLKAQLSSSTGALAATREEVKKLEQQLKSQQQQHEADLSRRNKTQTTTVQELEQKIRFLEEEIEQLKRQHQMELESLGKMLMEAHRERKNPLDDGLEARIRFLQHQNKQEKIKLQKELSKR